VVRILPRREIVCAMKTTIMFSCPIDPEGGAARAGPAHLADRALIGNDADLGSHRKAEPEAEARSAPSLANFGFEGH
jgi:hypothetical protein